MPPPLHRLKETPSQTAGPFVHIGMAPAVAGLDAVFARDLGAAIAGPETPGERIRVTGVILDGDGVPVRDAVIETWQADAAGLYASPADPRQGATAPDFTGWGRFAVDLASGEFAFETVKPGPAPGPQGTTMAPHIALWIVARGVNLGLATRLYFPDEDAANAADPILARAGEPGRRATLIAEAAGQADGMAVYRFVIRLQGADETVFFAT
ncbi:MAG: protocatechuate 3,4-dioxygenase subunit alpha [Azospirillaceae bacterium]